MKCPLEFATGADPERGLVLLRLGPPARVMLEFSPSDAREFAAALMESAALAEDAFAARPGRVQ
ncbi:MAG: hypothetical protein JO345_21800 [Streptosporangiaceae bacterium]|nr:hypothetical protein [Streptosporangiaceae bacterium]